jgi:diguanylate cyclase (GGDEF)-like protein
MSTQSSANQSNSIQESKPPMMFSGLYRGLSDLFKRAFDLIIALLGLITLSPFFAFIALLIKRDSPGPVFYWGPRVCKNGRNFNMLKFRTMFESPESYSGPRLTSNGDPRITPLGIWLRETKINELPQLWNVLIGEMSLVGPRPEDPEIAKSWAEQARCTILSIRPGITSPASILYHDEEKLLSNKGMMSEYYESILPEKNRLDLLYVRHHSFFSDLDTIFWTLFILVPRWAKLKVPEGYLFAGPIFRIANRYISWFMIDLVESLALVGITAIIWRTEMPLNWGVQDIAILGIILALLFSGINSIVGLNRIVWSHATAEDAFGLIASGSFVTVLILGLNQLVSIYHWLNLSSLPMSMIIVIGLLSQVSFVVTRYRLRLLAMIANRWLDLRRNTLVLGERVLVVGNGEAGQIATWMLSRPAYRTAFSIVGIINDNDPTKNGMRVNGYWMLGTIKDIPAIIMRYDIGIIVSTAPTTAQEVNEYIFDLCQKQNIRLIFLNDLMLMVDRQVTQPIGSFEYPIWLDESLEFKAMHDAITGLPNRYLFQDRIKRAIAYAKRYKSRLAVLFVRIERKNIKTDELGRKYGDHILMEVAKRLATCERGSDTLAYVGKNKFAVILENLTDEGTPDVVAKRIFGLLSEPIKVERLDVRLNVKINICLDTNGVDDLEAHCNIEIDSQYIANQKREALNRNENALVK